MNKHILSTIAVCATIVSCLLPTSSHAGTFSINGNDTASATFNRPTESGTLSLQNPHFDAYFFNVDFAGAYNFSVVASDPANYDTFLHIYRNAFSPADPATNFLAANDDAVFGSPDLGSALSNVNLTPGTSYYLVADGYFSTIDYGAYTATISGPGNITASLVPEPSSVSLIALAAILGGWLLARRRRRASAGLLAP